MKYLNLLLILCILFSSCRKNNETPAPDASFTFRNLNASEFKMGTYDTCSLNYNALLTDSVKWDLGNGTVSNDRHLVLSYPQSGTYNITLTIKNKDGKQSSVTKKVTVLDRVLKKIIVKSLYWDPIPQDIDHFNYVWPQTATADIFIRFQKYTHGDPVTPYSGLFPDSPVLYTSAVVSGVANQTHTAFEIPISGRFVLDKKMILDHTLVMSLMAKDSNGQIYNLMSNQASGSSWGFMQDDFANNKIVIVCNLMSSVELDAEYE